MFRLTQIVAAVLVLLAVALGGYAWWLGGRGSSTPSRADTGAVASPASTAPTFPAVVTTRRVAAGETLAADALQVVQLPIAPPGILKEAATAVGRVPVADLAPGALVTETALATGFALRLAEGERAVAIRADEVMGVANRVQPGDFVDVFVMLKSDGREVARSQARLLLSRQRVLAYGSASVDGLPPVDNGTAGASVGAAPARPIEAARTAVLAVPVQDVARLALGEANGRLLLALRHPGDTALPDTTLFAALPAALRPIAGTSARAMVRAVDQAHAGLAMDDLAGGGGALPTSPPPVGYAANPQLPGLAPAVRPRATGTGTSARGGIEIESIRGDKRETVSY